MKKYALVAISLSMLSINACAARNSNIVIDPTGVDMGLYQTNLVQCQQLAMQVQSKAGKGLVGGAVAGAVVGDIVGNSDKTRKGAKLGALGGVIKGARATRLERLMVVKNCLRSRGYVVLN